MQYEQALAIWGAGKIEQACGEKVDPATVEVSFVFDEGYACCGGSDPSCYCSFAESPTAEVAIIGIGIGGATRRTSIDSDGFDFATVLAEIVAAGGGRITGDTPAA